MNKTEDIVDRLRTEGRAHKLAWEAAAIIEQLIERIAQLEARLKNG